MGFKNHATNEYYKVESYSLHNNTVTFYRYKNKNHRDAGDDLVNCVVHEEITVNVPNLKSSVMTWVATKKETIENNIKIACYKLGKPVLKFIREFPVDDIDVTAGQQTAIDEFNSSNGI